MSLNSDVVKNGSLVLLNGDRVIYSQDGVECSFEQDHMAEAFKGTKKGSVFLTSSMIVIMPKSGLMRSLTMPFANIRDFGVKQPVFGANYLSGTIIALPGGGWEGKANFKMVFTKGGALDMATATQRAVKRARNAPQRAPAAAPIPHGYAAPFPGPMPPQAAYPAYPNGGAYYPPQPSAPYPPPNAAYPPAGAPMPAPPPYYDAAVGVGTAPPQPAYVDPYNQNVYIPQQAQPSAPPPPYTEKPKSD